MDYGLKKYVIKEAFGPYKKGAVVSFNEEDAKYFKDKTEPLKEEKKFLKTDKK